MRLTTPGIQGITLAITLSAALMGCGNDAPPAPTSPPPAQKPVAAKPTVSVKIGHAAPLTGPQAHLGKDNENGANMAIEEANAKNIEIGGAKVKFELLAEDDQADGKQATTIAQRFVDAKVNGVIAHLNSGATIPASKIYSDNNIPQISPSATAIKYTHQGFKTAFRVMSNDEQQGKVLGGYATNQLKAKTIAIIDDKTSYGEGLAIEFKKAVEATGVKVVAEEHTDDKAVDFAAILTKVKSKKPDLIFYGGMDAQAGPLAQQMKKLGLKSKLLMGDGGCTVEFHKLAGVAAEGHYCSLPGLSLDKMPGGLAFKDKYKAKYNLDIQLYAAYVYDATNVMIDAMKRANSVEPAKYLAEIGKTSFDGVTGKINFDENGDVKGGAITLYQAKAGQWETLETIGGAPAEAAPAVATTATTVAPATPVAAPAAPSAPAPTTTTAAPSSAPATAATKSDAKPADAKSAEKK